MYKVRNPADVSRPFGPTENPFSIKLLKTRKAKNQAFDLILQQVSHRVHPITTALDIISQRVSKPAFEDWLLHHVHQNIIIGYYHRYAKHGRYSYPKRHLVAVDILNLRKFNASQLEPSEYKGEPHGNYIKYLNVIHKHVQAHFKEMEQNNYYLTSLDVFTQPRYNCFEIKKEMVFMRQILAKRRGIEVTASAFIGEEMQGVGLALKYDDIKVLNCEEMLQLGLKELIIRKEFPIKIMGLVRTIKQDIKIKQDVNTERKRKNEDAGAFKVLSKVQFTNIRGLHSNIIPVHHHLETEKPHLLFLMESKIATPLDATYLDHPGYSLEHKFKKHAGLCVYVRNDICCQRLRCYEDEVFSTLWLLVDTGSHKTIYVGVYRSHGNDQETTRLFDYLTERAHLAQHKYPTVELVFLGDFNACHKEWLFPYQKTDHAGREAWKFATSLDLRQLVTLATRVPDVDGHALNCLDLLLTTDPNSHSVSVWAPLGSSDHCLVKSVSRCSPDLSPQLTHTHTQSMEVGVGRW